MLSIALLACHMSAAAQQFARSLALPFFGIGMKTEGPQLLRLEIVEWVA